MNKIIDNKSDFTARHIGPRDKDIDEMLGLMGFSDLESFINSVVPQDIQTKKPISLPSARTEKELLDDLRKIAGHNALVRSFIGMGYHEAVMPSVIQRNILENPGWYTQYTPYQAEISQGRLEALLNFQTMVSDLTGMEIANASLLDEATAAAEAMAMCYSIKGRPSGGGFFISEECHPQTIAVIQGRAQHIGVRIILGRHDDVSFSPEIFGALVQYPSSCGEVYDYSDFIQKAHKTGSLIVVSADLLSLALLKPPGEIGADVCVGSTQRFGLPLAYGGPHAAYFATKEAFKRQAPGRIIGLSIDSEGKAAARLALQTREQHIRREKATSNICTSQVLLAVLSSMYAVYHGPHGIKRIAERVLFLTRVLNSGLAHLGFRVTNENFFDTLSVESTKNICDKVFLVAEKSGVNFRKINSTAIGISLDEATSLCDIEKILEIFSEGCGRKITKSLNDLSFGLTTELKSIFKRESKYLTHKVFNSYHSETEMLRYLRRLEAKDLSLTTSMIPLGSCTMKLSATTEMYPISWPEFSKLHPFAPVEQAKGYGILFHELEKSLAELTGFSAVSLQPNAGSQGEYSGLLVIKKYLENKGESCRNVCLIPRSAHGTNPASAVMAGLGVVTVDCDQLGNIDIEDLKKKALKFKNQLAVMMVTYPSTHGVFEEKIKEICRVIHECGGQVYMDGANLNAQIGLCRPAEIGADVCHINLHKTFSIPHGGGGPGVGPIAVKSHLVDFLPSHPVIKVGGISGVLPVSAAPWGSAGVLPIAWMYILLMGAEGLKKASMVAILNANYIAKKLTAHYPLVYKGINGFIAHECILDVRRFKESAGVEVEDVAKRLMDYGFHAPTISFPVPGTMMIEPTESESKAEIDRFCEAMISIREEIAEIENGKADRNNNVLKNAPHTAERIAKTEWPHPYSREKAAFPSKDTRTSKFWPPVGRINNVVGDRQLICRCI